MIDEMAMPAAPRLSWTETAAFVVFGALGMAMFTLMPSLLGALSDQFGASASKAGVAASLQLAGTAIGGAVVLFFGHLLRERQFIAAGAVMMAVALAACAFTRNLALIGALWAIAGVGGGVMNTALVRLAASHARPAQTYAVILIAQMVFGFVGFLILPFLLERSGLAAVFLILGAASGAALPLAFRLGAKGAEKPGEGEWRTLDPRLWLTAPVLMIALSILSHYVANTMVWTFADRLGVAHGASATLISVALAGSMVSGMAGASISEAWCNRLGMAPGILVGVGLIIAATAALLGPSVKLYVVSVLLMNFAIMFVVPIYLGFLAKRGGEDAATFGNLMIFVGLMTGPALGTLMARSDDYRPMVLAALALFTLAFILAVAGIRLRPKRGDR